VKVTCLALEPGGGLRPEAEAKAVGEWRAGGGPYWIDLHGSWPEGVIAWLAGLGLSPRLLELLREDEEETRILPLDEAVFVAYPIPSGEDATKHAHFRFLCLDRLVVTMHEHVEASTFLERILATGVKVREGTPAGLICTLSVVQAVRLRRHVVALRREGDALADRMDADPQTVSLKEILALKRRVLALGGVVDEELAILQVLKLSDRPLLPLNRLAEPFQIAIETMRATDRDIDRLDRRGSDLQQRYESAQQELTNHRLGLLTVLSAIFMPLTLIVGIYGMNFENMPELHTRYGYPLALGAMALIAGGLIWYFRTRWWPKGPE
jgi:magnesium transporter